MRKLAVLLSLLVGAQALAGAESSRRMSLRNREAERLRVTYRLPGTVVVPAIFRFLHSTAGVGNITTNLCAAANTAGMLTGSGAWCLNGDGTQPYVGGLSLTRTGVTQTTFPVCPNGTDCAAIGIQSWRTSTDQWASASTASIPAATSFSACVVESAGNYTLDSNDVLSKWTGNNTIALTVRSTKAVEAYTYSGAVQYGPVTGPSTLTPGLKHLVCFTYQYVSTGTNNVGKVYVDGTAGTAVSTLGVVSTAQSAWLVGNRATGIYFNGSMRLAFFTQKLLSATDITTLNGWIKPTYTGSNSETLTTVRAGAPRTCATTSTSDGYSVTLMPTNTPCIANGALRASAIVTNLFPVSENMTASTQSFAGSSAADTQLAPSGLLSAEDVTSTSAGGYIQLGGVGTFSTTYTNLSAYVKSYPGQGALTGAIVLYDNTAGAVRCTLSTPSVENVWTRLNTTCTGLVTSNAHVVKVYPGGLSGTGRQMVWGIQINGSASAQRYMHPYVPTSGTTVSANGDVVSVATTSSWPKGSGSVSMLFTPDWSTATFGSAGRLISTASATLGGWQVSVLTSGTMRFLAYDAGLVARSFTTTAAPAWVAGTQYRVKVEWNGTAVSIYRDGALVGSGTLAGAPAGIDTVCYLGSDASTFADGLISDVCVGPVGAC